MGSWGGAHEQGMRKGSQILDQGRLAAGSGSCPRRRSYGPPVTSRGGKDASRPGEAHGRFGSAIGTWEADGTRARGRTGHGDCKQKHRGREIGI
jgi:hypothetical protein